MNPIVLVGAIVVGGLLVLGVADAVRKARRAGEPPRDDDDDPRTDDVAPADVEDAPPTATVTVRARPDHWYFSTSGLTRPIDGRSRELTLRVARDEEAEVDDAPPEWSRRLMDALACVSARDGAPVPGAWLALDDDVACIAPDAVAGLLFVEDPESGVVDTGRGIVQYVQAVGVPAQDLALARSWSVAGACSQLALADPLLVTDPDRPPLQADEERAASIAELVASEGSVDDTIYDASGAWLVEDGRATIDVGVAAAALLAARLADSSDGRAIDIVSPGPALSFRRATRSAWTEDEDDDALVVDLAPDAANAFVRALQDGAEDVALPGLDRLLVSVVEDDEEED